MSQAILILSSFSTREEAARIARALVEKHLIACAHVFAAGESFYRWEGAIKNEAEHYALFKTTQDNFAAVEKEIRALHSYEMPCILALPVAAGHAPFLEWIFSECRPDR
jgi:periplasmic divalent cation tolerance protein